MTVNDALETILAHGIVVPEPEEPTGAASPSELRVSHAVQFLATHAGYRSDIESVLQWASSPYLRGIVRLSLRTAQ